MNAGYILWSGTPEMAGHLEDVLVAVAVPDFVLTGAVDELLAAMYHYGEKLLVVVYKENETDGFILTAYSQVKQKNFLNGKFYAEIIIPDIMQAVKSIKHSNADNVHIQYDGAADVMYVNFGALLPADDSELDDDDILYRYRNGEIIGLTITHYSKR